MAHSLHGGRVAITYRVVVFGLFVCGSPGELLLDKQYDFSSNITELTL